MIWRVWLNKGGDINYYRNQITYPDILKMNALLDMEDDYECGMVGLQDDEE